jgi:hypothetical protein
LAAHEVAASCPQLNGIGPPWMAGITYVSAAQRRSFFKCIEAIEVQQKIVYDTNKKPASDHAIEGRTRKCLVCRKQFFSAWSGQRICQGCKTTAAWRRER